MENKVIYTKKIKKNQQIWNYIRRNRNFRFGELMMVCDVGYSYLSKYIRFLEKSKYIIFIGKKKLPLSNREYKFINYTGVKAPVVSDNSFYDYNTNKCFNFSPHKSRNIEIPENLIKILNSVDQEEVTINEILEKANIPKSTLGKWWVRLKKMGVITGLIEEYSKHPTRHYTRKYKLKNQKFLYGYNLKRAKEVKKAIEIDGVYTYINRDLKSLWIHTES